VEASAAPITADARAALLLTERADGLQQEASATADRIRNRLRRELERVEVDQDLNEVAKQRRADELRERARETMLAARSEYEARRLTLAEQARRACFGSAPARGSQLAAFRDAADRAARLETEPEAREALRRAIRNNDRGLASAIAQHSHDRGWVAVVQSWADRSGGNLELARVTALLEGDLRSERRRTRRDAFRWAI
jgi:hypothetical protein